MHLNRFDPIVTFVASALLLAGAVAAANHAALAAKVSGPEPLR
jgi:hypothetical protein